MEIRELRQVLPAGQPTHRAGSEMNPLLQQPFFQVTLPVVLAMGATVWVLIPTNNRRLVSLARR
jgi:hypothetical protein